MDRNTNKPVKIGQMVRSYFSYWVWFLIAMIIGLFGAYTYLKLTDPVYASFAEVIIKDDKSSGQLSESSIFEDLGVSAPRGANTENEIEILRSTSLMQEVIKNLGLEYKFKQKGKFKNQDLYNTAPIQVLEWHPLDTTNYKVTSIIINAAAKDINYTLTYQDQIYKGQFGSPIDFPRGSITLVRRPGMESSNISNIAIDIPHLRNAALSFIKNLSAAVIGKKSTILKIDFKDINPFRSRDLLNELIRVYSANQLGEKGLVMKNTLIFIDGRIKILTGELNAVEGDVERFKSNNAITSLSAEGELLMSEASRFNKSITDLALQEEILKGIKEILNRDPQNFEYVPSNTGITNLVLSGLMQSFNQLLLERDKAKSTLGPSHPSIAMMEGQLNILRSNIIKNISGIQRDLQVSKTNFKSNEQLFTKKISGLPKQERLLIEIQRQQSIKQDLYLYLLQKKEETALNLAVAVGNNKVLEPAAIGTRTKPIPIIIWLLGFLFGLILPISIISLFKSLNDKIWSESDIKLLTGVPILGTLAYVKDQGKVVVLEKSRSIISEMFRLLRANIQFIGEGVHNKVIIVTSSSSGEGKSFVSINLGMSIALTGKKVLMMELDMRKPMLASYLGHIKGSGKGITEFLVKSDIDWKELINVSEHHPMLHYTSTGHIPPNPSELLISNKFAELISILKSEYDFIIMDTPPIGMVSDALLLGRLADVTLFIVRQGKTLHHQLEIIEEINENKKLPRPFIILNAVKASNARYGSGYGTGYGSRYSYGYYHDDKKKNWMTRIFSKGE